mgnify:CR=1 FL=1
MILPDKFVLAIDGWSKMRVHCLAVVAVFMHKGRLVAALLGSSPLHNCKHAKKMALNDSLLHEIGDRSVPEEAINFRAIEHLKHICWLLETFYKKTVKDNAVCFLGDNCSTNYKMAKLAKKKLDGCRSHRHSIQLNKFVKAQPVMCRVVSTCTNAMKQLRSHKNSAALRNSTALKAIMLFKTP